MNLSRRSLLTGLFAAPAVIAVDRLMPVRLFIPTIYGDAVHDDWEGLQAWVKGEKVNILPRGFKRGDGVFELGEGMFMTTKPVVYPLRYSLRGAGPQTIHGVYNERPQTVFYDPEKRMTII